MAPLRGLIFSILVFSVMLPAMHTWSPAEAIRSSQFQRFQVPAKFKEALAFRNGNECPLLTPWIIVHHHVYDCTRFLKDHPGGMDSILINAGLDCTEEFDAIHSTEGKAMLEDYRIGELVTAAAENGSSCPSSDTFPWIEGNDSPAAAAQVVDRDQRGRDFETRGSQSDAKDLQARLQDPRFLYDASSGRDGKKFVMVVAGLSILSVIGAWCSFLTLLYMGFMVSLTLPALYHKYEDKIDRFVDRASVEVKRPYVHISDKVTVAKKKLYIWFDDRVLRKILWRRVKPE